jgi:predicted DNA binding protein
MSLIAEFIVPADQFALSETLDAVPEMTIEVEQIVAHGPDHIMPYFWTTGGDYEEFETAARDDPSVKDFTRVDETDDKVLYRANWVSDVGAIVYAYTETGAILLTATGHDHHWKLQLRFDTEEDVTKFNTYINETGLAFDLTRLYEPSHLTAGSHASLTEVQEETIRAGLESGYYEIPRKITSSELAEQFGISRQALSNRFRRAHRTLAENAVVVTPPDETEE